MLWYALAYSITYLFRAKPRTVAFQHTSEIVMLKTLCKCWLIPESGDHDSLSKTEFSLSLPMLNKYSMSIEFVMISIDLPVYYASSLLNASLFEASFFNVPASSSACSKSCSEPGSPRASALRKRNLALKLLTSSGCCNLSTSWGGALNFLRHNAFVCEHLLAICIFFCPEMMLKKRSQSCNFFVLIGPIGSKNGLTGHGSTDEIHRSTESSHIKKHGTSLRFSMVFNNNNKQQKQQQKNVFSMVFNKLTKVLLPIPWSNKKDTSGFQWFSCCGTCRRPRVAALMALLKSPRFLSQLWVLHLKDSKVVIAQHYTIYGLYLPIDR